MEDVHFVMNDHSEYRIDDCLHTEQSAKEYLTKNVGFSETQAVAYLISLRRV